MSIFFLQTKLFRNADFLIFTQINQILDFSTIIIVIIKNFSIVIVTILLQRPITQFD